MKVQACLFDLDGVLVDTAKFHFIAWKQLADRLGFEFTIEDNERLKGVSRMDSLEILLEIGNIHLAEDQKKTYAAEKNLVYLDLIHQMTSADVLPGVRDFLDEIRRNNILTALGSASKNARLILERTGLISLFDAVVDGNLITLAKPDPEVFLLGARMLGTESRHCVVFEDAVAGVRAAHNAGMYCVGIGSPEILKEADVVIPGFSKIHFVDLVPD